LSMRVRFTNGGKFWTIVDGDKRGHGFTRVFRRKLDGSPCRWRLGSSAYDATNIGLAASVCHNLGQRCQSCCPRLGHAES
jgi:hypothetical protein